MLITVWGPTIATVKLISSSHFSINHDMIGLTTLTKDDSEIQLRLCFKDSSLIPKAWRHDAVMHIDRLRSCVCRCFDAMQFSLVFLVNLMIYAQAHSAWHLACIPYPLFFSTCAFLLTFGPTVQVCSIVAPRSCLSAGL